MIPPGSFHSQFEDQVGFHVYQMPGPCPPIQKLNLRLADSTHLSTSLQKEDTRVRVFADSHASSQSQTWSLRAALGLGRLASWQAPWEAGPSAAVW